ncbi:hypothetical protein MTO96_006137 [Rhipicephalus appendiculatus]
MSFNQDDNDMEDIGHERDAGQLDDNKNPGQDDDDSTNGWTYVTYKKKKDAERKESATSKSNFSPPNPRKAGQMIADRILNSSKMPKLPEGDVRVIIRPRDGLNIRATCSASLDEAIYEAAGLTRDDQLTICPNLTQNIVVVSTPESATAERLRRIKEIQIEGKTHEVNAYVSAPDDTAKGIIRNVPLKYTQEYLLEALVTNRNPSLIHAKRLGSTTTIILLFNGYRVPTWVYFKSTITRVSLYKKQIDFCKECGRLGHRLDVCPRPEEKLCTGCGMRNPTQEHDCKPRCKLCGEGHPTADRLCRAKFKTPYIVKQRRWAARAEEREPSVSPDATQPDARPQRKSRGTSRSRSRSTTRSRSRSKPREGTPAGTGPRKRSLSRGKSQQPGSTSQDASFTTTKVGWSDAEVGRESGRSGTARNNTVDEETLGYKEEIKLLRQELEKERKQNAELAKKVDELCNALNNTPPKAHNPAPQEPMEEVMQEGGRAGAVGHQAESPGNEI